MRYTPYLRWQGTTFDPDDPTYIARYRPFHDQTIQAMTLAGQPSEGQVFRSASTLHLFEGDELVLSRAYTFGPAIHPLTPINNVPAMATTPSVRDVLRMRGGFTGFPESYLAHSLIDASTYGQYPITGAMMYDYVVLGGRLGVGGTNDNYCRTLSQPRRQRPH